MEKYIQQLIDDIRTAGLKIKPPHELWENADPDDEIELEDLSHVEKYVYGEEIPISNITGIDEILLPPPHKLTQSQMATLAGELEKLLELKNFALDFPENLPMDRRYPFIRKFWEEKHVEMSFGTSHIEFCQYEPENCPYPDYCQCKDFVDYDGPVKPSDEINTYDEDGDELPF